MSERLLDHVERRVAGQLAVGIYRAYLGYVPVNREFENVCDGCGGDGCRACNRTGEKP